MRFCLSKLDHTKRNNCCGSYPQDDGLFSCWLISEETSGLSFDGGAHRGIMIGDGEEDYHRTLYNFTMSGLIDLGFYEISGAAVNDTITSFDIAVYPDGVSKTQIHLDTNVATIAPKNYMAIDDSFLIMPQTIVSLLRSIFLDLLPLKLRELRMQHSTQPISTNRALISKFLALVELTLMIKVMSCCSMKLSPLRMSNQFSGIQNSKHF